MKCRRLKAAVIWLIVQGKPCLFLSLFFNWKAVFGDARAQKSQHPLLPYGETLERFPRTSSKRFL